MFNKFFSENCAFYDTSDRPQMIVSSIHLTCWMPKATNTLRICNTVLKLFHGNNCWAKAFHFYLIVHSVVCKFRVWPIKKD